MNLNQIHEDYVKDPLLVDSFAESLLLFVQKYVKSQCRGQRGSSFDTVEDAVGASLLKIWKDLPRFDPLKSPFESFVITKIKDSLYEIYNRYGRQAEVELLDDLSVPDTRKAIESRLSVKALLSTLSDEDKSLVSMKLEGGSDEDIAAAYNIPIETLRTRWKRLKNRLKQ